MIKIKKRNDHHKSYNSRERKTEETREEQMASYVTAVFLEFIGVHLSSSFIIQVVFICGINIT